MATIHDQITHPVIDDDIALFTINPVTRAIEYNSPDDLVIMQNDTNSERLSFEIPKIVEGHDMSLCDVVQVHYINVSTNGAEPKPDIYLVTDLAPDLNNDEMLRFTWLVSRNATQLVGSVKFAVRFFCTDASNEGTEEDEPVTGKILYEWSTGVSDVIKIGTTIRNDDALIEELLPDVISGIQDQLTYIYEFVPDPTDSESTDKTFLKITNATGEITYSDNLKGEQGKQGETGPQGEIGRTPTITIGTVKTVDALDPNPSVTVEDYDENNNPILKFVLPEPERDYITDIKGNEMWFFTGTQEEYSQLSDEERENLFALITDDAIAGSFLYGPNNVIHSAMYPGCTAVASETQGIGGYAYECEVQTISYTVPEQGSYDRVVINKRAIISNDNNSYTFADKDSNGWFVHRTAKFDGTTLTLSTYITGWGANPGDTATADSKECQIEFVHAIVDGSSITINIDDIATFGSTPKTGEYLVNSKGYLYRITDTNLDTDTVYAVRIADFYNKSEINSKIESEKNSLTAQINKVSTDLSALNTQMSENKSYNHYVRFNISNPSHSVHTIQVISVYTSYISKTKTINSLAEFINDISKTFGKGDNTYRVLPCTGIVTIPDHEVSTSYNIAAHINDNGSLVVFARDESKEVEVELTSTMSTGFFYCTTIEI